MNTRNSLLANIFVSLLILFLLQLPLTIFTLHVLTSNIVATSLRLQHNNTTILKTFWKYYLKELPLGYLELSLTIYLIPICVITMLVALIEDYIIKKYGIRKIVLISLMVDISLAILYFIIWFYAICGIPPYSGPIYRQMEYMNSIIKLRDISICLSQIAKFLGCFWSSYIELDLLGLAGVILTLVHIRVFSNPLISHRRRIYLRYLITPLYILFVSIIIWLIYADLGFYLRFLGKVLGYS